MPETAEVWSKEELAMERDSLIQQLRDKKEEFEGHYDDVKYGYDNLAEDVDDYNKLLRELRAWHAAERAAGLKPDDLDTNDIDNPASDPEQMPDLDHADALEALDVGG